MYQKTVKDAKMKTTQNAVHTISYDLHFLIVESVTNDVIIENINIDVDIKIISHCQMTTQESWYLHEFCIMHTAVVSSYNG